MPGKTRETGRVTPPKPKKRWIIYYRLSIGDPNMERDAARQRAELTALVKRLGGVIVAELGTNDRSASEFATKKRSEYAQALAMLRRGEADAIAISRVDRILRRMDECTELLKLVRDPDSRIEVWDCSVSDDEGDAGEEMRLNTAQGRKRLQDQVNAAEYETAILSWRVKRSTAARRADRLPPFSGAFGWKRSPSHEPDPEQSKLVEQMIRRVLAGESMMSVAKWLNAQGIPRRKSKLPWDDTAVKAVITCPRNYGLATDGTPLAIDGIVPAELYGQMLDTLASRPRSTRPRRAEVLAGLVHCAECEYPMLRSTRWTTGAHILQCRRQHNTDRCGAGNIDYAITEKWLTGMVFEWVDGAELADLVAPAARIDTDAIKREQARLERELKEAWELKQTGALTLRGYALASTDIEAQLDELASQLTQRVQASVLTEYVGKPGTLARRWKRLPTEVRRQIIAEALNLKPGGPHRVECQPPEPGGPGAAGCNVRFDASDPALVNAVIDRLSVEQVAA